jgi:signal transduction histidine kinase/DNA-binding NarL/FixJ family response regulator
VFQTGGSPRSWGQGQVRLTTRHKSGRSVPVELSISRTESETGDLYVAFLRDLSSQLASEQALMMARDKALAGEKAKSDLLVVMSHEIRTPLNGMIGTIDLLGATRLATKQKEYLRILEASGRLLMHHVNDVLDIARLDSGKATYSPGPVDLDDLVQEVIENQSPTARLNGNTMRYTGPAKGGAGVLVDSALLRQVLLNLVGNAVKFTRGGEIAVRITHLSPQGPTEICVSDTGIGIAAADLDRIFDDFVTLDASYARKASGTGLGLGIVRRIVERMGGSLQVDSTLGKGSLFRVLLPLPILSAVAQPQAEPAAAPLARTLLTLVVEDNDFNRMIIGDMLRQDGHEVVEAHDGQEGIALAAARRFDLIFMDISMPGVDGLQAARAIAEGPGLSRQTPVLAMTAHAQAEDVDRFKAAGMRDALIKPITRQALQRALVPLRHTSPSLLDLSVLHEMEVDLGASRAGDLLARFLAETGQTVADLVEKVHSPGLDPVSIGEIHRLEGSAAMFGALALRKALSQIQTLWKSGAMDEATLGLPGLQSLWQQTHQAYCDMGFLPQLSSLR